MTIRIAASGCVELVGHCPSEDAEPLLQHLLATPGARVDWRECREAHTAVVQVLLAARPELLGPPGDVRLRDWVEPVIVRRPE